MSDAFRSGLYTGTVRHRRSAPRENAFRYGVYQLLLDLSELPALDRAIPFFGYNRAGLISFHDQDHMGAAREPVRDKLGRWLHAQGRDLGDSRVMLLTNPRVFGYVFNPVSYFFCLDDRGGLRFTVAEVFNTFGEAYCYLLDGAEAAGGRAVRSRVDKRFHVSPFMPIDGVRYEWVVTPPGDHLTVHIDQFEAGAKYFDATLTLARRPLTSATLGRAMLRYPHLTARTVFLIHWQAAKLWAKRVPFFRKPAPPDNGLGTTAAPAGAIERVSRAVILGSLRRVRQGRLRIRFPDGSTRCFGGAEPGPGATITVHDPRFFRRMLLDGEVGAGEAYIRGEWSVDSPMDAVRLGILNRRFFRLMAPLLWPAAAATWLAHRARTNTVPGSRRNIADHYDLGNDFFALFLDPSMTYSCAYFDDGVLAADTRADRGPWAMTGKPGRPAGWDELVRTGPSTDAPRIPDGQRIDRKTLERAQLAKYRRLAARAGLRPGRHVLEIGCGWGGFAEVAASEFGCRVTGVTISRAQASYARERMARAGLADRVSIELVDYREITGVYDCVVSIEMLEAVGHRFLPEYFRKCDEVLAPGGRAVLQVITIPDNRYLRYRMRPDFIQRFIFPGAHLPSLGAMRRALSGTTLRIADREDLAPHYGPTLAAWRQRLLERRNAVYGLGFDEAFVRRWEFYFAYCEAAFRTRYVADWQLVLERKGGAHK